MKKIYLTIIAISTTIVSAFAQTVHTRSSYRGDEVVFGAKFLPIIKPGDNSSVIVEHIRRSYQRKNL